MSAGHHRISELLCPYCSVATDCVDGLSTNKSSVPVAGAASLCAECWEPSIFFDGPLGLALRRPNADERKSIMAQYGPALLLLKLQQGRS